MLFSLSQKYEDGGDSALQPHSSPELPRVAWGLGLRTNRSGRGWGCWVQTVKGMELPKQVAARLEAR